MAEQMNGAASGGSDEKLITIKKYANRRLYNTATSTYVTLETLAGMVKRGEHFQVFDAKTGEDITRSVLTQIIFEEEAKGENLLPINFLRQLITFYGNSMQSFVPSYLEMSLEALRENQSQYTRAFGGEAAMEAMDQLTRRNMEFFEKAMQAFVPMATPPKPEAEPTPPPDEESNSEIDMLKEQMAQMQKALDAMSNK